MSFKGVLIDFGDTLAYADENENRTYVETLLATLREHGFRRSFDDANSILGALYRSSSRGEPKAIQEFWIQFLHKLAIPCQEGLINSLEQVRRRDSIKIFRLHERVLDVLSVLQEKYKLVLVSNCAIGARDLMNALGLSEFFEHMILSYETKVRKPDKRIYVEALRALRLPAGECIFIADEISDLEGARELGMKTLLVRQGSNTYCEAKDPNFKPDFQCEHVSEIIQFL